MKLFNTGAGIVIEHHGEHRLLQGVAWDELIDNDALYERLVSLWPALHQMPDGETILADALLPPMQGQELWAAGATYRRSGAAGAVAADPDFHQQVYEAERPQLFFKANRHRVAGHGQAVRIRRDSVCNVPEPELTLVVTSNARIVGYTIGNDMTSRSLAEEGPLYLPQAKIWDGCAVLGPCVWVSPGEFPAGAQIHMRIEREGREVYSGSVAVDSIQRRFEDLVACLFSECSFPAGVLLMTGAGIIPEAPFALLPGDRISIAIDHIGTLVNTVA